MAKVSRTYRIEQETADRITEIAENENMTATEVVEDAIRAYSSEKYVENTANQVGSADSPALAAVRVLAGALQNAPRRLHRVGDALNLVGQALKTNPDHDNLLAF